MNLIDTFRYHSKVLEAKSSALDLVHHAGDRGMEREDVLEEFLTPLLPERFGIGRGEIRATNGKWSKQGDLIIYDRINSPRLFVGTRSQVFPAESVAAVIEVKSNLGSKEIHDATVNINQARSLAKEGHATHIGSGAITFGPPTPIFGALFAYDLGIGLDTFRKHWNKAQSNQPASQRINLTCILGKMVVMHIDQTYHLWDKASKDKLGSFYPLNSGQDSLLTFTLALMRVLAEFRFGTPELFKHVFSGGEKLEFKNVYEK